MDEEYVETVLALVDQVPPGRVTTYGALAVAAGRAGPRQAGGVMARYGDAVAWWRVVHADGSPATCHDGTASERLRCERTPMRPTGAVDLASAMWWPDPGGLRTT